MKILGGIVMGYGIFSERKMAEKKTKITTDRRTDIVTYKLYWPWYKMFNNVGKCTHFTNFNSKDTSLTRNKDNNSSLLMPLYCHLLYPNMQQ